MPAARTTCSGARIPSGTARRRTRSPPSAPFQIAPELREKHGYPQITPALRAKVFGQNALKVYSIPADVVKKHLADRVSTDRVAYREERADPRFVTYGPRTRREFLNLKAWGG
jgi:hypothetical protein